MTRTLRRRHLLLWSFLTPVALVALALAFWGRT